MARLIVLVHFEAASLEEFGDVVGAEERGSYLEAASAAERTIDVILANNCVTELDVIATEHLLTDVVKCNRLTGTDLSVVKLHTVTQEQLVKLFNFRACAE